MKRLFVLTLLVLTAAGAPAATISLQQPVAKSLAPDILYLPFDETGGSSVRDLSGHGFHAEMRPGSFALPEKTEGAPGFAGALFFPGAPKSEPGSERNPFLQIEHDPKLTLAGLSFTMGVWLKLDDDSTQAVELITKGASSTTTPEFAGYTFAADRDPSGLWRMTFQIRDGLGANPTRGTGYTLVLPPRVWAHFAVTYDYETRSAGFWFNGVLQGTEVIPSEVGESNDMVIIGERRTSLYVSDFRGSLDDLFIAEGCHDFEALPVTADHP